MKRIFLHVEYIVKKEGNNCCIIPQVSKEVEQYSLEKYEKTIKR